MPLPPLGPLQTEWTGLESEAAATFFQSWTWIGAWLDAIVLPNISPDRIRLIRVLDGATTIGLAIVCAGDVRRLRWWTSRAVFLHETGDSEFDQIAVEYNGILSVRGREDEVLTLMLSAIADDLPRQGKVWRWAVGRFNCLGDDTANVIQHHRTESRRWRRDACPLIVAAEPAGPVESYIDALSVNTRSQLRRSFKLLGGLPALGLSYATPATEQEMLAELETLHRKTWQSRQGHSGAFASLHFGRFVASLIRGGLANGSVRLVRIHCGSSTLGVLLNFSYRGRAYAYLSGFAKIGDNRIKPGLVCHLLVAHQEFRNGAKSYHFMAGESRYKRSLGNSVEHLSWVEIGKPSIGWHLESAIHAIRTRSAASPSAEE